MIDIIKDYDSQPAFADFLPGIAGENGIPAWCFFVNRGQGVASFGTQDKDHPIMEFRPAHTVYPPLFPLPQAFLQTIRAIPPLPAVSRSRCRFFRAPAVYKPFSSLPDSVGAAHLKRNTGTDFGSAGVPKSTPANPSAQIHADGQRKYPVRKRLPGPTGQAVVFLPPHKKIQTQNR